ncbi:TetR/AcrR family transcriptional regulator [Cryobacterium roopkundense]|nr:TetR/AcrR family transcriptional regulator [Cryobacterium roopkundense]MBB5641022.1 AcrR family transcriptional regulator [Cryobacterium roopkundense]
MNDTEIRIFESARVLFNEWGYTSMTLRQIAKDVGIEVQSIYNYTSSKQALVEKLVRTGTAELHSSVVDAIASAEPAPTARLRAAMQAHVLHYLSSASVVVFFRDSLVHFDSDTRSSLLLLLKEYEQLFKDILREGIATGAFRELDVTPTTYAILGMGDSVTNWWRAGGRLGAPELSELYGELAVQMVSCTPADAGLRVPPTPTPALYPESKENDSA